MISRTHARTPVEPARTLGGADLEPPVKRDFPDSDRIQRCIDMPLAVRDTQLHF